MNIITVLHQPIVVQYYAYGFPILRTLFIYNRNTNPNMPYTQVIRRARILWWIGAIRIYEDGHGWAHVCRWWNPVIWILFLILIPLCAFEGEKITEIFPIKPSKYFQQHPEKLIWWSPFSSRQGKGGNIKGAK